MKKYKLLKDLPTFKAGDIFYLSDRGNLFRESDNIVAYNWSTLDKFTNILTDWFDEIKEQTRLKPDAGQTYYFLDSNGLVYDNTWADDSIDRSRFEIGNCFKTEEEIERAIEYLESLAVVRGDSTSKFTKGCKNWRVYYDSVYNYLAIESNFSDINNGIFGLPYFATEEDAQKSIELHRNEWLTIFGVDEEK